MSGLSPEENNAFNQPPSSTGRAVVGLTTRPSLVASSMALESGREVALDLNEAARTLQTAYDTFTATVEESEGPDIFDYSQRLRAGQENVTWFRNFWWNTRDRGWRSDRQAIPSAVVRSYDGAAFMIGPYPLPGQVIMPSCQLYSSHITIAGQPEKVTATILAGHHEDRFAENPDWLTRMYAAIGDRMFRRIPEEVGNDVKPPGQGPVFQLSSEYHEMSEMDEPLARLVRYVVAHTADPNARMYPSDWYAR